MTAEGDRIVDIGGLADGEEPYEGKVLVIFAVDPGVTTGWSCLKVPVGLLSDGGVARTLVRCRWQHGQIYRSTEPPPPSLIFGSGGGSFDRGDSRHVDTILEVGRMMYERFMDDEDEDHVFAFVWETFSLRMMGMDPSLLAPVRLTSIFTDRLIQGEVAVPVFLQQPSEALGVISDVRLKRWGMYDPSSGRHARDADRHAITFLRRFASQELIRKELYGDSSFSVE